MGLRVCSLPPKSSGGRGMTFFRPCTRVKVRVTLDASVQWWRIFRLGTQPGTLSFFFCNIYIYIYIFTQVQTPVTLFSGELWSILVVRLAHSADLRSRLRHVSSAPSFLHKLATIFLFSSPSVIELSILTCTGTTKMFECLD